MLDSALALLDRPDFEDLCRRHGVGLAVLFGSMAKGNASHGSDIDLAVLLDHDEAQAQPGSRLKLMDAFMEYLHTSSVDLVVLNHADSLLRFEIARSGRPVYQETASAFAEFCSLAVRQHEDSRVFYRAMDRYLTRAAERGTNL